MDPLTHTLTGLMLGRAGLNRWTPQSAALLMLAANAPDIDIVTAAGGSLNYLHYHRHLTHSLAAMPVIAALPVALVWAVGGRKIRWPGAFFAAIIAVASHLLLDYTNLYGIRLLLPFSPGWQRLDLAPVIDLSIWSAMFLGLAGPFLARLVTSEITSGKPIAARHGAGFAWFVLIFLLLYFGGRAALHARAVEVLNSRLYDGSPLLRVAAMPQQNPLAWRGLVETADSYYIDEFNLTSAFNPAEARSFHKPLPDPALDAARQNAAFRTFLDFSAFPLWQVTPLAEAGDSTLVEVFDLRFGTPTVPGFRVSGLVDARGEVTQDEFQFGNVRPR
jgi:inner membrane protein